MDATSTKRNDNNRYPRDSRRLTAAKLARIIAWVLAGLALACFLALIFGVLVKWLWGLTLTPLFGVPQPSYWQAVGLIILAKLFFGGFGHPHKSSNHSLKYKRWHDRFHGYCDDEPPFFEDSEAEHGQNYRRFWEEKGRKAFKDYLDGRGPTKNRQNG